MGISCAQSYHKIIGDSRVLASDIAAYGKSKSRVAIKAVLD